MIRNRMPLVNLLVGVLLTFSFMTGCFGFAISMESRSNSDSWWIMLFFVMSCFVSLVCAFGIWQRVDGVRILLKVLLYLGIVGWSVLAFFWWSSTSEYNRNIEKFLPIIFSVGMYSILAGGISFLNNEKVKAEFIQKKKAQ